jgi:hypothetical protein
MSEAVWACVAPLRGVDMGRPKRLLLVTAAALLLGGCATGPLQENPLPLRGTPPVLQENPVWIPPGPQDYGAVFEYTLTVLSDYFEIDPLRTSRFAAQIETFPSIAPGLEQPWKPGSPDFYQRLLASLQSIRHRAIVHIMPQPDGGYKIDVKVFKELEDVPQPSRATAGAAIFRSDNTLERQFEVVEEGTFEPSWIPIGRDLKLEQVILQRLASFDRSRCPTSLP